ncbi:MAG: MGMT family protein [Sphaerochaetaceae bacterium]
MDSFFKQVYNIVGNIPTGKVASYGQIAWLLGRPHGARTVGWAMHQCPDYLPWHRVIRSDGGLSGNESKELQRVILESEGIVFLPDGRVDMSVCQWDPE